MAIVARFDDVENEQNDVNHVPDAETAQSDQFADPNACVSDAASIDGKYAEKD